MSMDIHVANGSILLIIEIVNDQDVDVRVHVQFMHLCSQAYCLHNNYTPHQIV